MSLKNSKKDFKSKNVTVKGYFSIILVVLLVMFDRLTKIWALNPDSGRDYGILAITYTANTGAGFSIMQNMNIWLIILSLAVLIAIIYFNKKIPKFSVIMIVSGIIGNVTDRIFYGSVIDFINFKIWPIFNVADSLIFIGVIYWIIMLFKEDKQKNINKKRIKK
jgi:signal peptidase II